jgi:hypothetical protein
MVQSDKPKKAFLKVNKKAKTKEDGKAALQKLVKEDYASFITDLKALVEKDADKFTKAVKELAEKNKVTLNQENIPVANLIPTQNEIDIGKSIGFPLGNMNTLEMYLACANGTVSIAGIDIIASKNIKDKVTTYYVVDGHHRWSQLYFINPDCKISSQVMNGAAVLVDPFTSLKSAQLSIAANLHAVPVEEVQGTNLLTVTKTVLENEIKSQLKILKTQFVDVFKKYKKDLDTFEKIFEYLWGNVAKMQKSNQPISGAPLRKLMPQTGYNNLSLKNFGSLLGNFEVPW